VSSLVDDALRVDAVSYAYLERYSALDEVSFSITAGERVGLVGANGSGKSTLLKLLAGLLFPDAGRFQAFGSEVTEDALEDEACNQAFRRRIGFIFQNADAQVFSPSVREEIAFGPLNMGLAHDDVQARVDDMLRALEIGDLADRAPYQLSGGQKKRVAIASVLVMNPDVLLFDEPTAALDPRTQAWLVELMVALGDAGKTIVVATHDLDTLRVLTDRCLVFSEEHRLVRDASPSEVLADRELLLDVNLVHEHRHRHGRLAHHHAHGLDHHRWSAHDGA
jgi:cobalt/nickel transport system ATP-binding protein